jgi:predicted SAM-dependent methyltransferase
MNPLPFNNKTTSVKYCDYKTRDELIKEYPDLKNFHIVETSYVCWADDLNCISNNSQDFVIASHVFEHLTNPIKALEEFYRVTKNEWIIYLVVPEKTRTWDKFRSITDINHIIDDYKNPSPERDLEHYEEFVLKYKNKTDRFEKSKILQKKIESFHYHVFTEEDVINIINWCKKELCIWFEIIDHKPLLKNNPADLDFVLIIKCHKQ